MKVDSKKINVMWSISLLVIGIATIFLAGANIIGVELPDITVRLLGVLELITLPVLAFSTVKKVRSATETK